MFGWGKIAFLMLVTSLLVFHILKYDQLLCAIRDWVCSENCHFCPIHEMKSHILWWAEYIWIGETDYMTLFKFTLPSGWFLIESQDKSRTRLGEESYLEISIFQAADCRFRIFFWFEQSYYTILGTFWICDTQCCPRTFFIVKISSQAYLIKGRTVWHISTAIALV